MRKLIGCISSSAAFSVLFAALFSTPALASEDPNYVYSGWTAGIGAGMLFFEADEEFNSSLLVETKLGYDISDSFTIEGSLGYLPYMDSRSRTRQDPNEWHLTNTQAFRSAIDLLYHFNPDKSRTWDPTLGLTAGVLYTSNSLENDQHFDPFGGLGFGLGYSLDRNWVARGDYRLVVAGHDTEWNHHVLVSLGYRFGDTPNTSGDGTGAYQAGDKQAENPMRVVYFDFDRSTLTAESKARLTENAEYLKANPDVVVTVEGHCDERGTDEYNLALGEKRAQSAKDFLRALGIDSGRLRIISYGEERPADPAKNEAAWAKNRRVECVPVSK
jgi:peptidoglycan-associated lipoprotein